MESELHCGFFATNVAVIGEYLLMVHMSDSYMIPSPSSSRHTHHSRSLQDAKIQIVDIFERIQPESDHFPQRHGVHGFQNWADTLQLQHEILEISI